MNPKYRVFAQILPHPSKKTLIVFQNIETHENIIQSIDDLINAKNVLAGFNQADINLIHYIAETARDL